MTQFTSTPESRAIGGRLAKLRESAGWSQTAFAREAGKAGLDKLRHQTSVTRLERGERKLTLSEAAGLAQMYGVSLDYLACINPESDEDVNISYEAGMRVAITTLQRALDEMEVKA